MPQFLKENDREIIRNVLDPNLFDQDSFEIVNHAMDIQMIVGVLRDENEVQSSVNPGRKAVQAVKFPKPTWTIEEALEWLSENMKDFSKLEAKIFAHEDLREIKGVEIFSAGTWNGTTFTVEDIDGMVQAFEDTKETVRPFLKLGHDSKQELLKSSGLPNAGTIGRLYRKGIKLVADFQDMPRTVFDLVMKKAYKKVSCEVFFGVDILDKKFKHLVAACSFLGAETPGVMNLTDILARFGFDADQIKTFASDKDQVTIKAYQFDNNDLEGAAMSKELKDAQDKITELEQKLSDSADKAAKFNKDDEARNAEIKDLKKDFEVIKADYSAKVTELQSLEIEKEADKLEAEKIITPGARQYVVAILGSEQKNYCFTSKDKNGKESKRNLTKPELVKELCLSLAVKTEVNLEENSSEGEIKKNNIDKIDADIEKYMVDHEVIYSVAYKAVAKNYEKDLNKIPQVTSEEG